MPDPPVLPSWRYHVSGASRIVTTVEELEALAPGEWFASPAEAAQAAAAAQATAVQEADAVPETEDAPAPRRRR
jgi:hypothetical protein